MVQMSLVAPPTPVPPPASPDRHVSSALAYEDTTFANLDAQPPYAPQLLTQMADQRSSASAQHVLSEAVKPAPTLTPAQLALLSHSLPPDERCWLIEGLCAALRAANERISHDHTLALMLAQLRSDVASAEELGALKATNSKQWEQLRLHSSFFSESEGVRSELERLRSELRSARTQGLPP